MSLAAAGLWIAFLWLVIYAVKYSRRRSKFLLPFSQTRRPTTEVTVKHLNIRLKTDALNALHDELSTWLSSDSSQFLKQTLQWLYDLGSLVGAAGMLLGFYVLFLTVASFSSELLHTTQDNHLDISTVTKRGLNYIDAPASHTTSALDALRINPIIPGLTVPLSHLPLILVALIISQIVHEAGHAISAALHRIPMLSCGVAVIFIFPSAFVTLPSTRLEKLPPRDRLRIVSSGCFHNLLLLCLLLSSTWLNFLPVGILFQDTSALGKVVVGVDYDSPLSMHLPVGTLITKVDDSQMASVSSIPWDHYLLSSSSGPLQGWCTDKSLLEKAFVSKCASNGPYSCFTSKSDETEQYELDPVRIFTDNLARCNSSMDCSPSSSCIIPRHDQQLVRISILKYYGPTSVEDTIVWNGPKEEIWEQVQVANLRPRFSFVSHKLSNHASTFFEYMKIANLSLYLVNMLPITALDGNQFLLALLHLCCGRDCSGSEGVDLEALSSTRLNSWEGRVQRACRILLNFLALSLVVLCGLLGTITSWAKT